MSTINVGKQQWARYMAGLSTSLKGKQALIEVAALSLGDQIEAQWVPLVGISYDRKDDIIVLDVGDLNHVIRHPTRVEAVEEGGAVSSIEVVDAEDVRHIVRLREPVMLAKTA